MEDIEVIKNSIIKKFSEMLSENLDNYESTGKFSSSEIGKEIGKFINDKLKDIRKSHSSAKKKKINQSSDDEKIQSKKDSISEVKEKKKRKPSAWNIYMKKKVAELKIENEKNGISKNPKEMLADIALLWKEDKLTFKVEEE